MINEDFLRWYYYRLKRICDLLLHASVSQCNHFFYRTILTAFQSKAPKDRFNFLMGEIGALSAVVSGQGTQLSVLNDQVTVTRCQVYEETCGRINYENLNHFMITGAQYHPLSDNMQEVLKKQVNFFVL